MLNLCSTPKYSPPLVYNKTLLTSFLVKSNFALSLVSSKLQQNKKKQEENRSAIFLDLKERQKKKLIFFIKTNNNRAKNMLKMSFATGSVSSSSSVNFSSNTSEALQYGRKEYFPPHISAIGFGSYRVSIGIEEHYNALEFALKSNISLIDTSANYGDGDAEKLIGELLKNMQEEKQIKRENIYIVSKFGYIQGENLNRYANGLTFPDTVICNESLMHCIHSDFMRDQLTRSIERMKVNFIDCYLLHNPEYYITHNVLKTCDRNDDVDLKRNIQLVRKEMNRRIEEVFVALEEEVQLTKRIKSYGISSNSFSLPSDDSHFLPYDGLLEMANRAACKVSGRNDTCHSFACIQLPGNLLEKEGIKNAAIWSEKNKIHVLINRPLNAIYHNKMWRLADYDNCANIVKDKTKIAAQHLSEKKYVNTLNVIETIKKKLYNDIFVYDNDATNNNNNNSSSNCINWESKLQYEILPNLRQAFHHDHIDVDTVKFVQEWLDAVSAQILHANGKKTRLYLQNNFGYEISQEQPLQEFALSYLLQSCGISSVLIGMRKVSYVQNALNVLNQLNLK